MGRGQTVTHWTERRGEKGWSHTVRRGSGSMQGRQQLLVAARDFAPNRAACLLSSPSCPQAGRPSKLSPGVMEWGQMKPLWLARSWQAIIFTPIGLSRLGDSLFGSVAGPALVLKREPWKSTLLKEQLSFSIYKNQGRRAQRLLPSSCIGWQRLCQPTDCLVMGSSFPAKLPWPKGFKSRGGGERDLGAVSPSLFLLYFFPAHNKRGVTVQAVAFCFLILSSCMKACPIQLCKELIMVL